jgi:hypothetical protein
MRAMLSAGSSLLGAGLLATWPALSAHASTGAHASTSARPSTVARDSIGVGIQADPVRLAGAAHPGGSYPLPEVYVVNKGTETESISITVRQIAKVSGARDVPPSWVQASSVPAQLAPGQAVSIPLQLITPPDARTGRYASDIVVTGSAQPDAGSQVRFGAAAATALEFSVTPGPAHGYPAWKIWFFVAVLLLTAATIVARHSRLRIRIVRGRPPGGTDA